MAARKSESDRDGSTPVDSPLAVLPTKLAPPDATRLVHRLRLHERLDAAGGGVVWVTGPAGSGKSSLAATWCDACGRPTVWYRLDASDGDVANLFEWLTRAVPEAAARGLPRWSAEQGIDPAAFAVRFFSAFFDVLAPRAVVVFDNVHAAAASPAFAQALAIAGDCRRSDVLLVMNSREAPQGALLRLASKPHFLAFGWTELRCTDDEARALAGQWGMAEPNDAVLRLADGWLAALVVLLRHRSRSDGERIEAVTPADVFDALAAVGFDGLRGDEQACLLAGAFAPLFDAEATRVVTGIAHAGNLLENVWREHFFLERRSAADGAAEYVGHPLMMAFLRRRALGDVTSADVTQAVVTPADLDRRVRAYADVLHRRGQPQAAMATLEAVGAWDASIPLFLSQCEPWMMAGKLQTLGDGLARIDAGASIGQRRPFEPALDRWRGFLMALMGDPRGLACFDRAHAAHLERGEEVEALMTACMRAEAQFQLWHGWDQAWPWADELERLYDATRPRLSPMQEVQVLACGASVMFPCFGHPVVERMAARSREMISLTEDPRVHLALAGFLIGYSCWMGRLRDARMAARLAARALEGAQLHPSATVQACLWIGIAAYCDGRAADPEIRGFIDRAQALIDAADLKVWQFHASLQKGAELLGLGDLEGFDKVFDRARALCPGNRGTRQLLLMTEMMQLNAKGQWRDAIERALEALREAPELGGYPFGTAVVHLQMAMAHAKLGEFDAAEASLALPERRMTSSGSRYFEVMVGFTRAVIAYGRRDAAQGDQHLRTAVTVAEREGFRHLNPTWVPAFFEPLLDRALEVGIRTEWVTQLIRQQGVAAPVGAVAWPHRVVVQLLGPFDILIDGVSAWRAGRLPKRAVELVALLALAGHRQVPVATVVDQLWPDAQGDLAKGSLEATLHRARKALDEPAAITLAQGELALARAFVGIDVARLQVWLEWLDGQLQPAAVHDAATLRAWCDDLLRRFTGPVSVPYELAVTASALVRQIQAQVATVATRLAARLLGAGDAAYADECLRQLVVRDPGLARLIRD